MRHVKKKRIKKKVSVLAALMEEDGSDWWQVVAGHEGPKGEKGMMYFF